MNILKKTFLFPLRSYYFTIGKLLTEDDRIGRRLFNYFPTYRAALVESINQLRRIFSSPVSCDVQGIVVEPTNFCNLRCGHCSTQALASEKKGYMDPAFFKRLIDKNPQLTCIILTRNGEPLMHPNIFEMIRYARDRNIYVALFTNGILLEKDNILSGLFESSLSEINFSMEGTGDFYERNRGVSYRRLSEVIKKVLRERRLRRSRLAIGINSVIAGDMAHSESVKKQWSGKVDYITVEPLMGQKSGPRRKPCRTLWRNMVVTWDGEAIPCCVDMGRNLFLGNIRNESLREIFNNAAARRIRGLHLRNNFPDICRYCDSYFG